MKAYIILKAKIAKADDIKTEKIYKPAPSLNVLFQVEEFCLFVNARKIQT